MYTASFPILGWTAACDLPDYKLLLKIQWAFLVLEEQNKARNHKPLPLAAHLISAFVTSGPFTVILEMIQFEQKNPKQQLS